MISRLPLKPISLAFFIVQLYFLLFSWSIAGLGLFVFSLLCLWFNQDRKNVLKTLVILSLFSGYFAYLRHDETVQDKAQPSQLTSIQVIPDTISVNGDLLSFRGKSQGQTYQAFYPLKSQDEQKRFTDLNKTVQLNVKASLEIPDGQRNFGGFNYRRYLKTQGIYRLARIEQIQSVRVISPRTPVEWLQEKRRQAILLSMTFPNPMRHYMLGLLFGYLDKSFEEMSDLYSSLGIIHLFALSGMQVGFFLGIFRYFFLRLGARRDYVAWLQVPFSFVYAGMTGFTVSVVRSLLQAILSNLGLKKLDNFAATLLVCFFIMPNFLQTTGGILSFAYAFILSMTSFEGLSKVKQIAGQTVSITFGVLPLLMRYFASFQPLSIVLTALLGFAFDLVFLPLLSLVFLLAPLVRLSFVNPLFELLEVLLKGAGALFPRQLVFGQPSSFLLLALLLGLGFLYDYHKRKSWRRGLLVLVALLFFICKNPLTNEVTVVDIGQGDSILLRDWRGKTVLIDTGGKVEFGVKEAWRKRRSDANAERTLLPYLKNRGIGKIDQLVLTHTDTDHMGDMEVVARQVKVGEVLVSQGSLTNGDFVKRLNAMKLRVRALSAGDRVPIMGSSLQVLYPWEVGDGKNNDSLVLYGKLLDKTFLFTGDLEEAGEKDLLSAYPNLQVDVLKAGHHGSKGSSSPDFIKQLSPSVSLISAGKNNRYKHPHQETLERLKETTIYRTDEQGAIRFSGWRNWKIETVR